MVYHTFQTVILPALISFLATIVATRFLMSYMSAAGIIMEDKNKEKPVNLPYAGLAAAFGIIVGLLAYVFGGSFLFDPVVNTSNLLAVTLSITLIAMVGFIDDINIKAHKVVTTDMMDTKVGLKQWQKPLLTALGALPLMAINAGVSTLTIPLIGTVPLGILFPLIILPLAVIFVSNAFNILGGFDGLQPGMALIAAFGLLIYFLSSGSSPNAYTGALLSAILFAALLAFLPFNSYRAKAAPGDGFTYAVGASLVAIMVMGRAETFGFIIFMPWIIEFFLHLRKRFKVTDVGIRQRDGTFKAPYGKKIYSLTHFVMNIKRMDEREVTFYLCMIEAAFVMLAFLLRAYVLL